MKDDLIPWEEARQRLLDFCKPLDGTDEVSVAHAGGRILAADLTAPFDMPLFNRALVDGWAVRSGDLPASLHSVGSRQAGSGADSLRGRQTLRSGETFKVMTGAPVDASADAVIMVEEVREEEGSGGQRVRIERKAEPWEGIARKGEDIRAGDVLIEAGARLTPYRINLLAMMGYGRVLCRRRPRVAVIVTGNELKEPQNILGAEETGPVPEDGAVYNANAASFIALCRQLGIEADYRGIGGDTLEELAAAFEAVSAYDLVLVSGGVSRGDYDLVRPALESLGAKLLFHRVAVKPGKPLLAMNRGGALFLGLPGNPVSTLVGFRVFVRPAILRLMGMTHPLPLKVKARFQETYRKTSDRAHFLAVHLCRGQGEMEARLLGSRSSGDVPPMAAADGIVCVDKMTTMLSPGDIVDVEVIRDLFQTC